MRRTVDTRSEMKIFICYSAAFGGMYLHFGRDAFQKRYTVDTGITMLPNTSASMYHLIDPFTITCNDKVVYTVTDPEAIARITEILLTHNT